VQSEYGLENSGTALPFDDKSNGYKLIVGWRQFLEVRRSLNGGLCPGLQDR
jgi:hypothetical protein